MSNQSWSIIVFGYNEKATFGSVINSAAEFCISNDISDYEIIPIDDGSTDGSYETINSLSIKNPFIKPLRHETNLGIGPAMIRGYSAAVKENVIAVPADGQFNITELKQFINFEEKSFLSFQREQKGYSPYRIMVSRANEYFNRLFLSMNVKDVNWVKAYKNSDLRNLDLKLTSSLINTEICSKLRIMNYKIHEIPSVYHSRIGGKPRGASFRTVSQAILELAKLALIIRKFKKKIRNRKSFHGASAHTF